MPRYGIKECWLPKKWVVYELVLSRLGQGNFCCVGNKLCLDRRKELSVQDA